MAGDAELATWGEDEMEPAVSPWMSSGGDSSPGALGRCASCIQGLQLIELQGL
jgi:hypothetical protein